MASPTVTQLRAQYRRALSAELRAVDSLKPNATQHQIDAAWARAEATNAALRALHAHPDYER